MRTAFLSLTLLLWAAPWGVSAAADQTRPEGRPAAHGAPSRPAPGRPGGQMDGRGQVLDARYNHGRYYQPAGNSVRSPPPDYRPYSRGGDRYYFNGGVWYAPRGGGFVVVAPPMGLVISVLPPYYSTVWVGGVPYYYADNVYYTWQPDQNGYAVVNAPDNPDQSSPPPGGGDGAPPGPSPGSSDFIIYPKNGQTKDQQAADEYECHNWARTQSGFDPTQPGGGVPAGDADRSHSNYDRAMSACLQGRGYQLN